MKNLINIFLDENEDMRADVGVNVSDKQTVINLLNTMDKIRTEIVTITLKRDREEIHARKTVMKSLIEKIKYFTQKDEIEEMNAQLLKLEEREKVAVRMNNILQDFQQFINDAEWEDKQRYLKDAEGSLKAIMDGA